MKIGRFFLRYCPRNTLRAGIVFIGLIVLSGYLVDVGHEHATAFARGRGKSAPTPLLAKGRPVDWWFVFKFNVASFPGCDGAATRHCPFGGKVQDYHHGTFSQQFVYASSANPSLQKGTGCIGDTLTDPLGATFAQVYQGSYYYLIWNDQFYDAPKIKGCSKAGCGSPWGHSKGMLAWNEAGEGLVMQVSTPSWPASGNRKHPRRGDGNTLGCIIDDDVEVSQHFFALKLTKDDLIKVLQALQNASVATDPKNKQIVLNGGPAEVQALVESLGKKTTNTTYTKATLSSGVDLISKPSHLHVPSWQFVSAVLDGVPLRIATWWAGGEKLKIYTTTASTKIGCWDKALGAPGPVEIATSGQWDGTPFGLSGGSGKNFNHAKIGVSRLARKPYSIFGDLNQQGTLSEGNGHKCSSSQNGRGGTFYVLNNRTLSESLSSLMEGDTAPHTPPKK